MTAPAGWAQEALLPAQFGAGLLRVDLGPGVVAGFTTRHGGVSPAPWSSLNLGTSTGDDAARVRENRARVEQWVGAPVAFATQVHQDGVLRLGPHDLEAWSGEDPPMTAGEADVLVTEVEGLGLGVLVADCVPVLLADPEARVAAVAHAGRAGLAAGVVHRALDALVERGASLGDVRAAVGPSVCGRCYEVPDDLRDQVSAAVPETWATTDAGAAALDLSAGVLAQLASRGVEAQHVDRCTRTDGDLYSHRRATASGTTTGRQAGVVVLA